MVSPQGLLDTLHTMSQCLPSLVLGDPFHTCYFSGPSKGLLGPLHTCHCCGPSKWPLRHSAYMSLFRPVIGPPEPSPHVSIRTPTGLLHLFHKGLCIDLQLVLLETLHICKSKDNQQELTQPVPKYPIYWPFISTRVLCVDSPYGLLHSFQTCLL